MRPLRLDLDGFTVFREPTVVDFTDADFFALVGPTGSGKSTVLDAICFALYGTVPRWGNKNAVANALAPSTHEAKVRLVFESAGARYVATRVIRRVGRGGARVETRHAGLDRLPDGFRLASLDEGLDVTDIGESIAASAGEMDGAVQAVIGLPYEQFVSCVVLPQGQFAQFLHAKRADRTAILVNLLGLDVYDRIREQATTRAAQAATHLAAIDATLADFADASDDALAAAHARAGALAALAAEVDAAMPELAEAVTEAGRARAALAEVEAEISRLAAVAPPRDAAGLAAAVTDARAAVDAATAEVEAAERQEEQVTAALVAAGDGGSLRGLLDSYAERDRLRAEAADLATAVARAETERAAAEQALAAAEADHATAEQAHRAAQTADLAAALRPHLVGGEPCPVCTRPVDTLPPAADTSALAATEKALAAARRRRSTVESSVRQLDGALRAASVRHEHATERLSTLDAALSGQPGPAEIRTRLDAIAARQAAADDARKAVYAAREAYRRARADAEAATGRLGTAWRAFDTTRDALAALGPPPVDRDDLAAAWSDLAAWAAASAADRRGGRDVRAAAVTAAEAAVAAHRDRITGLFTAHDLPVPAADPARAAAVAAAQAASAHDRLVQRRADAARLRGRRETHERDHRVARALAQHLQVNKFKEWLLAEALDRLVTGAAAILRELSSGQYELVHAGGEFGIVDHHDAALRRSVRTLSGGETFQASLALALALSEQLAGMSTATASLESIVLDEGFGTLDAATLDTVTATLENLAARGDRMVGVVTHVAALADRIPVRFEVSKDARTARVERNPA